MMWMILMCSKKSLESTVSQDRTLHIWGICFFTRAQGPNETIDAYVTDLKNKAKDCEFGRLTEDLIKDRIVCGVNNDTES